MVKIRMRRAVDFVARQWEPYAGIRHSIKEGDILVYTIRPRHNVIRSPTLKKRLKAIGDELRGKKFKDWREVQRKFSEVASKY